MARTRSGCETLSSGSDRSSDTPPACSMVPIAPSHTSTRLPSSVRTSCASRRARGERGIDPLGAIAVWYFLTRDTGVDRPHDRYRTVGRTHDSVDSPQTGTSKFVVHAACGASSGLVTLLGGE